MTPAEHAKRASLLFAIMRDWLALAEEFNGSIPLGSVDCHVWAPNTIRFYVYVAWLGGAESEATRRNADETRRRLRGLLDAARGIAQAKTVEALSLQPGWDEKLNPNMLQVDAELTLP